MRTAFAITTAALLSSLLTACTSAAQADRLNCEKLKPGMSESAVNDIMGPAHARGEYPDGVELRYGYELEQDGPVSIWLVNAGQGYVVDRLSCDGGGPDSP